MRRPPNPNNCAQIISNLFAFFCTPLFRHLARLGGAPPFNLAWLRSSASVPFAASAACAKSCCHCLMGIAGSCSYDPDRRIQDRLGWQQFLASSERWRSHHALHHSAQQTSAQCGLEFALLQHLQWKIFLKGYLHSRIDNLKKQCCPCNEKWRTKLTSLHARSGSSGCTTICQCEWPAKAPTISDAHSETDL